MPCVRDSCCYSVVGKLEEAVESLFCAVVGLSLGLIQTLEVSGA